MSVDDVQLSLRYGLSAVSVLDQSGSESNGASLTADYRLDDLPAELDVQFHQQLDQLNLIWYSPMGDFTLGRQAISFGQAKVYSPIDVIQPADILATDQSYRPGVDAIRVTWLVGAVSELDAGYVFGQDEAVFVRLKAYLLASDWELIGIAINSDNLIGSLGLNSGIGPVGLWQETALMIDSDSENIRVTVGADYTLFDDLYVMGEIHFNGLGEEENYSLNSAKEFYRLGAVLPNAQWYSSIQLSYPLNIVTQLSGGGTVNLNDGSVLINTAVSYSASDSLSVKITGVLPMARENSADYEYGIYPAYISLDLDWVF